MTDHAFSISVWEAENPQNNRLWKEETIIPKLPLDIGKSTAVLGSARVNF